MKNGADITILAPLVESSRNTFEMIGGSVSIRSKGDDPLTMERALFLLEQTRIMIWGFQMISKED